MKYLRFLAVVCYASYLVNVGLLLVMLPWSEAWSVVIFRFPASVAFVLDEPAVKGVISAFGLLHLILVVAELTVPLKIARHL